MRDRVRNCSAGRRDLRRRCPHWLLALALPFSRNDRAHIQDVDARYLRGCVRRSDTRRATLGPRWEGTRHFPAEKKLYQSEPKGATGLTGHFWARVPPLGQNNPSGAHRITPSPDRLPGGRSCRRSGPPPSELEKSHLHQQPGKRASWPDPTVPPLRATRDVPRCDPTTPLNRAAAGLAGRETALGRAAEGA